LPLKGSVAIAPKLAFSISRNKIVGNLKLFVGIAEIRS
jgi:hypothetical protein